MGTYRKPVQQRLSWVLMHTVTRINHPSAADASELVRRARGFVAQNDDVRCHRFKITGCVEQGLTLNYARASNRDIERVCTQTFLSNFE